MLHIQVSINKNTNHIINFKINGEQSKNKKENSKKCTKQGICKNGCVVEGACEEKDVIYKATCIDQNLIEKVYIGETAETFKKRCGNHYTTFNHKAYKNSTTLANYIWELQEKNITYQLTWEILERVPSYNPKNEYCRLCIAEKKWIMHFENEKRLNKNDELVATCRHRRKFQLGRIKGTEEVDLLKHTAVNENKIAESENTEIFIPRRSCRERKPNTQYEDFILERTKTYT